MFDNKVTIWVDGGDSSFPMKVKKGTRVFMSGGRSYIAGQKRTKKKYYSIDEMKFMLYVYGSLINHNRFQKIDLKTRYELIKNKITISKDIPSSLRFGFEKNKVHIYDTYEQYEKVLKYFAPDITEEELNNGIYSITKKGQIVVLDEICFNMISNSTNKEEKGYAKKLIPNNK